MEYDLVIVGGGPAGLSAAIRAKQVAEERGEHVDVCVVEKSAEIGGHMVSGNIFEPRALNELIPDWKEKGAPLNTPVTRDTFHWLPNSKYAVPVPMGLFHSSPIFNQEGNYIMSLSQFVRWLAEEAEELGVEIYPGFAAAGPVIDEDGVVKGVRLSDMGIAKDGTKKDTFEPGMELIGKQTILTEGARGSVSEYVMDKFNLRKNSCPQTYGLGLKEVWEIKKENHMRGTMSHTVGYPLDMMTYGGGFIYHLDDTKLDIGLVVGLDYSNPHLSPYEEFQRYKKHARIQPLLEGGRRVSYGARVLSEGGLQALPKLTFPGGMLAGCSAGFLNVPKIKGSHTAMKTGMIAGESAVEAILAEGDNVKEVPAYANNVKKSWVWEELNAVRNFKPAWHGGLLTGMSYGSVVFALNGREPWTFKWTKRDCDHTKPAAKCKEITYEKPDGQITFDLLDNLINSGVNHEHDQPAHLKIKPERAHVPLEEALPKYAGPEGRLCPAKVYEYLPDDEDKMQLVINAQNCIHCKCCSIKATDEFINWTVPEGGGGPQYTDL